MVKTRHDSSGQVLVRFWSLDHHRAEQILWPSSSWTMLVFAQEGTLLVETENEVHLLPPSRAMLIQAGMRQRARTTGKARVRTLYFADECHSEAPSGIMEVRPLFRELILEACRIGPLADDGDLHHSLVNLLILEMSSAERLPSSLPMPKSEWLSQWAGRFLHDPSSPDPREFSKRTLERRMLEETGLTWGQWRQQAKALCGMRALAKGSTVVEASMEAGYETSSGFIQAFKRQFGMTPGKFGSASRHSMS